MTTLKEAREALRPHGMVIKKTGYGDEHRVNHRKGKEEHAYYSDDRDDAVATGISMAKRAAELRMKGEGSHDPVYKDTHKNK